MQRYRVPEINCKQTVNYLRTLIAQMLCWEKTGAMPGTYTETVSEISEAVRFLGVLQLCLCL